MKPVVVPLPGNEAMAGSLASALGADLGASDVRRFPDGESYVRLGADVESREVVLVCTLDRPDEKFMQVAFAASTARDLGAKRIGLVCPYLAYMRQDTRFRPGEAVSVGYFAKLLGAHVDWLVTVDPHLHRLASLDDVFSIPTAVGHAAPLLADWIRANVADPILIGPDSESEQWVGSVAAAIGAPYAVLSKTRRGDRDVSITLSGGAALDTGRTPVLVDDIVSTARTMIEAVRRLGEAGARPAVCVGVHAVFAAGAYAALQAAGAARIVTCNTIPHPSNGIDIVAPLAAAIRDVLDREPGRRT